MEAVIQQADSKPGEQQLEELRKTRIDHVEHKAPEKQQFCDSKTVHICKKHGIYQNCAICATIYRYIRLY